MGRALFEDRPSADSPAGAGAGSAEGVSMGGFAFLIPASSACARSLFLPGTQGLPVILRPDGPTRPIQRLPVRGTVPPSRPLNRLFGIYDL
jgi:hypothetical protein